MKPTPPPAETLHALSPLDGRYYSQCAQLRDCFSEFALMRARVAVEVEWLIHLSAQPGIAELPKFSGAEEKFLRALAANFSAQDAARIKAIDKEINHDVKAVEYFIKEKMHAHGAMAAHAEFVHFACTSDDINNLSYALLVQRARAKIILPRMRALVNAVRALAKTHAAQPMLARTHGQPASPTTVGKEFANFAARFAHAQNALAEIPLMAKFNGASGNFNAHLAAYPNLDWHAVSEKFVTAFGLHYQRFSTQIEPRDYLAAFCDALCRFNTVMLDLDRDMWGYISLGYFRRKVAGVEVGSSAMPHKVNPINFENSEGNIGVANALLRHFSEKLPVSRWQRDLSDSTVLRNLGVAIGHAMLALDACARGLSQLELDAARLHEDLERNWEVLAEAVQTVMRRHGIARPYEKMKALVRGRGATNIADLRAFIETLQLPAPAKQKLLRMTPADYTGCAAQTASEK